MNKITKSFLMLLLLGAGAVSAQAQDVPAQDDWFKGIDFCYRDQSSSVEEYRARTGAVWGVDPDDANNGCIVATAAANATAHTCQFWIRGAEYVGAQVQDDKPYLNEQFGNGGFSGATGFKVTMRVKADGEYSNIATQAHKAFQYGNNGNFGTLSVTTSWQTVSFICLGSAYDGITDLTFNLSGADGDRTFYFDDIKITRLPAEEDWFDTDVYRTNSDDDGDARVPVSWVIDPDNPENSCFTLTTNDDAANKYDRQLWIRATAPGVKMNNGQVAKLVMRVKAERAQPGIETQYHQDWKYYDCWRGFGGFDVTTDWQTLTFTATADANGNPSSDQFTDFCFNLSDVATKTSNTFYFDDVRITVGEAGQPDWFVKAEPWAADYEGFTEEYTTDPPTQVTAFSWTTFQNELQYYDEEKNDPKYLKTQPEKAPARWVADGGYLEVKSNPKPINNYDSQLFIQVSPLALKPQQVVTISMQVQADLASEQVETQVHKGVGDWTDNPAGDKIDFTVGEWTDITRTFSVTNEGLTTTANGVWYVLNLSNGMEANSYRFKNINVVVKDGADEWYKNNTILVGDQEPTKVFGDDFCIKVSPAKGENVQLDFTIPSSFEGKKVKMTVKVKASEASEGTGAIVGGEEPTEADGITFTNEWAPAEVILDASKGGVYALTLPGGESGVIDYFFDDLAFELAPVDYQEPDLADTEKWYQDIAAQGFTIISRGEPAFSIDNDKNARYITGNGAEGDYIEIVAKAGVPSGQPWQSQIFFYLVDDKETTFPVGTEISIAMNIKASEAHGAGSQAQKGPGGYLGNGFAQANFTTDWTPYTSTFTVAEGGTRDANCFSLDLANTGASTITYYLDDIVITVEPPINPDDYTWTDLLNEDGSFENADKSDYFIGKIMKGHQEKQTIIDPDTDEEETVNVYVFDEDDPEFIRLEKSATSDLLGWKDADGFEFGENVLDITPARQKQNAAGEYAGNDWDSQFFIRLPYVLPQGTKIGLVFDVWASQTASIPVQEHMEADGNGYLGDFKVAPSVAIAAKQTWQHVAQYGKVDRDMRSIVFNLACVPSGAVYRFDNVQVLVDANELAAIQEYQETLEAPAASWENILALNETIYDAKQVETEDQGYTEASVQALEDAIAAGKALLKENKFTDETLTQAESDVKAAVDGLEKAPVDCDLTADMYFRWDAVDATAKKTGEQIDPAYVVGSATTMPYGDGSVNEYNFADLSAYDHLVIIATDGEPRLLFNRAAQDDHQGPVSVELPRDKELKLYEAVVDNGDGSKAYVINLKAIVDKDGYAHLNVIKANGWNGTTTTVTAMKLFVGESEYSDALTAIESVEETASTKDGKYFINGQIVIVKDGKKYNAAGVEIE